MHTRLASAVACSPTPLSAIVLIDAKATAGRRVSIQLDGREPRGIDRKAGPFYTSCPLRAIQRAARCVSSAPLCTHVPTQGVPKSMASHVLVLMLRDLISALSLRRQAYRPRTLGTRVPNRATTRLTTALTMSRRCVHDASTVEL